jgi:hypothetical protein
MTELAKIKEPEVFLGVARVLKVRIVDEVPIEGDPEKKFNLVAREASELIVDVVDAYDKAGRDRKKELLKILRAANQARGEVK